ncbi:MAG: DUF1491 family protein [Pseudomonadota bacterium]
MTARVTASLWVSAHIRRCTVEGVTATVIRHGAEEAGQVLLKITHLGDGVFPLGATALQRVTMGDGSSGWMWLAGPDPIAEVEADARLARQIEFDADAWVVEIEDRDGRHFLDEPIAG